MKMHEAFEALRQAISQPGEIAAIDAAELGQFAERCVVALPVGGLGSRMRTVVDEADVHKSALRLATGETMLELTLAMYRASGFTRFVALVSHHAQSVMDVLGNGSQFGVSIAYSADPGGPVGRGGAIRNALENGSIAPDDSLIVHNPDDVILHYDGVFPRDLVATHLAGVAQGSLATAVLAEGVPATYTGMRTQEGFVQEIMAYPALPVPAHVGITAFAPAVYPLFPELFDLTKKSDFEPVLFPELVRANQLYSMFIPARTWVQVNDPKSLATLNAALTELSSTAGQPAR
jgi:NDP-sugar pyrophosphorylase family protein